MSGLRWFLPCQQSQVEPDVKRISVPYASPFEPFKVQDVHILGVLAFVDSADRAIKLRILDSGPAVRGEVERNSKAAKCRAPIQPARCKTGEECPCHLFFRHAAKRAQ